MNDNSNLKRHAALVDRMATVLGIDLEEKMMEGQMQVDALGDAVLLCTSCANPDGCEQWLDMQTTNVESTPGICRNADMFAQLKAGKRV